MQSEYDFKKSEICKPQIHGSEKCAVRCCTASTQHQVQIKMEIDSSVQISPLCSMNSNIQYIKYTAQHNSLFEVFLVKVNVGIAFEQFPF
jgi:hypothetical protein